MKNIKWLIFIFVLTFILSTFFSGITTLISDINIILMIIILFIVILIGIISDMIGVAVLTGNESTFHAKASKKIKGAKESVQLLRKATNVSSICNDVIGDICGIISGALGTTLSLALSEKSPLSLTISAIIIAAVISTLTVGGKAIAKEIAIKNCDNIIFILGKFSSFFKSR